MSYPFAATGNLRADWDGSLAVAATSDAARHARLEKAAGQFEACMMQELLKPLRGGDEDGAGAGLGSSLSGDSGVSGGSDTLLSVGTEAMAEGLARAGGLGIARKVVQQVERQAVGVRSRQASG
jgi:Rod binding domain-containing protein